MTRCICDWFVLQHIYFQNIYVWFLNMSFHFLAMPPPPPPPAVFQDLQDYDIGEG